MTRRLSRRQLLIAGVAGGAGLAGAAGLARAGESAAGSPASPSGSLPPLPTAVVGLPAGQHVWDPVLRRDEHGNPVAPRQHQLLLLDVAATPTPARVHERGSGAARAQS